MRRFRVTLALLAGPLLAVAAMAPTSGASERAERRHEAAACKDGGWQELLTAGGEPFRNQGQCVSYVQRGGTLTTPDPGCAAVASEPDDAGWELVAHMSNVGGMFDGDGDLAATYSFGTFVAAPAPGTLDFQRAFPVAADDIMFRTGDGFFSAVADYGELRALIDAAGGEASAQNLCFETSDGTVTGNVLSRTSNPEDPWIAAADGNHFDGIVAERIVWGDHDYALGTHQALKNNHGGIDVYIRA